MAFDGTLCEQCSTSCSVTFLGAWATLFVWMNKKLESLLKCVDREVYARQTRQLAEYTQETTYKRSAQPASLSIGEVHPNFEKVTQFLMDSGQ